MRKPILYFITVMTFPLIVFNILATVLIPWIGYFNYKFIHTVFLILIIIWGCIFGSSLFLQRAHCSHSCAMSGMFEIISRVTKNKDMMSMKYPLILKYIVLFFWFFGFGYISISLLANHYGWFYVAPIYTSMITVIYYFLFVLSAILSMTIGKSKTEHYVCPFSPWMIAGIKISGQLHLKRLSIVTDASKCVQCKQCNQNCLINEDVCKKVKNNCFDQSECVNCLQCVKTCRTGAIRREWARK